MSTPKKPDKPEKPEPDEIDQAMEALGDGTLDDLLESTNLDAKLEQLGKESPLEALPYDKGMEKDTQEELSVALRTFKESAKAETKLFQDTVDSEYWFCVCFQNRDQKEAFLKALGLFNLGDKYLNGLKVAQKLGIALPPARARFVTEETDKRLTSEVGTIRKPPKS